MPWLGARLLSAARAGIEVIVVTHGDARSAELARILNGRPIPCAWSGDEGPTTWLDSIRVEVDVPVPTADGRERRQLRRRLASLTDGGHRLVEVDPRPAFEELATTRGAALADRAAGAAGVLAGRLAARNRRWRSDLD